MAKINTLIIILFFAIACKKDNAIKNTDRTKLIMIFLIDGNISVHLKSNTLNIQSYDFTYEDSILLTPMEIDEIYKSYFLHEIDEISEKFYLSDKNATSLNILDSITIFDNNKLKTSLVVNYNYKKKESFIKNKTYQIISFRDDVKSIIKNNKKVIIGTKKLKKYLQTKNILML